MPGFQAADEDLEEGTGDADDGDATIMAAAVSSLGGHKTGTVDSDAPVRNVFSIEQFIIGIKTNNWLKVDHHEQDNKVKRKKQFLSGNPLRRRWILLHFAICDCVE